MANNKKKAMELIAEAEKRLGSTSNFFSRIMGRSSDSKEEAIELYNRAGNMLKMEKEWDEAGGIFKKVGSLYQELDIGRSQSSEAFLNAAKCYMKVNPQEAVNCLMKTIEVYTDLGKFSIAAKYHVMVAEIYENEQDIPKTIEHYSRAADYYQCEESSANASRCLLNVARYAAMLEQYQKAIEIYESVGQSSVDNKLLKYGAKDHFLRAGLCHLCVDLINTQIAIKKYEEICPQFADSRECKLLKDIMNKIEVQDSDGFEEVVREYDSIYRLDQWFTKLLVKIRSHFTSAEDDLK